MEESTSESREKMQAPGTGHYSARYLGRNFRRLYSYVQQVINSLEKAPNSVLVIGKGDGVVVEMLKPFCGVVHTLDVQEELVPDIVGSVLDIPCADNSYDLVICSQVLEHIEFEDFSRAVEELGRVASRRVVLSLPDVRHCWWMRAGLPKWKFEWQISVPRLKKQRQVTQRSSLDQHAWEIGFKGASFNAVRERINGTGKLRVIKAYRVYEVNWHTFIVCDRTS